MGDEPDYTYGEPDYGVLDDFHPTGLENVAWNPLNLGLHGQRHQASVYAPVYPRRGSEPWDANDLYGSYGMAQTGILACII